MIRLGCRAVLLGGPRHLQPPSSLRWCSAPAPLAGTTNDILTIVGDRPSETVANLASKLNIPASQLDSAIADLEKAGKLYRYRMKNQWDVVIRSPDFIADKVLSEFTRASLVLKLEEAEKELQRLEAELKPLEELKERLDAVAAKYPNKFGNWGLVGMTGLWCLLFWMVFADAIFGCQTFAFDWNLVEPITYFLGYSVIWFGVVYYYFTGSEYTYDSVREQMEMRKRAKLYKSHNLDIDKYTRLTEEFQKTQKTIEELANLR